MIKLNSLGTILFLVLTLISFTLSHSSAEEVKTVDVSQICGSYMDEPMSADSIYNGKTISTTIKVSHVRKVRSLCHDAPRGTFTMDTVLRDGTIVQCFCNAPIYQSVLHSTPKGSSLTIEGEYKSVTSSFFEGDSKQCTLTLKNCIFK